MDVDTDNFEEALGAFEEHLPGATFVAVDLEMTGIVVPPGAKAAGGDLPQAFYAQGRAVVGRPYNIVQVGLCLFEELAAQPGEYVCRPFNVFLFPRPVDERDGEGRPVKTEEPFLGLSASAAAFLHRSGLDFNRWVTKGVAYASADVEKGLLAALEGLRPEVGQPPGDGGGGRDRVEPSRPADVQFVNDTMQKVANFTKSEERELKLPSTNAFLALALRQRIAEKHPGLVIDKRPSEANPHWQERWVLKLSEDDRQQRFQATRARFLAHIGFRRMWSLLKASRKPTVFHNGFYDLLFLICALEGPLPPSLPEFKRGVREALPSVFDTKLLAESPALAGRLAPRTSLGELAAGLARRLPPARPPGRGGGAGEAEGPEEADAPLPLSFSLPEGYRRYAAGDSFHTAGYDAYETGRLFAFYRSELGEAKLRDFENRVYLMFSAFELQLAAASDRLAFGGVARYLYDIDTKAINNRGLAELFKPLSEGGKRKFSFSWCSDSRSLLLLVHGSNGSDDLAGMPGRAACEQCLDSLLLQQERQGRLRFRTAEEHLQEAAESAAESAALQQQRQGRLRFHTAEEHLQEAAESAAESAAPPADAGGAGGDAGGGAAGEEGGGAPPPAKRQRCA